MKTSRLLIDGDILTYRTCWAVQNEVEWDDGMVTTATNLEELYTQAEILIRHWQEELYVNDYVIAFSDPKGKYFRHKILAEYKGNRKSKRKPLGYKQLVQYLKDKYQTVTLPDLEADDVLGILATDQEYERNVIVSIDKDMLTIPCEYYNMDSEILKVIKKKEADYMHLYQTLVGDATDNYKGCPGVGPKKATIMLDVDPSWVTVLGAFQKAGLSELDALIQAQVARILRTEDYNIKLKEILLWFPPTKQEKTTVLSVVR